ncbi:sugar ABC transporter ATP-binding protein [Alloscardovia theropitheci]|uniref:Sugar ABC transporter ATP-binding protein n=1 Tax=Alloscardovia theropitheci TaxID=2496842 RepID=A0A4R0R011_9BIFI|nr:ATP-binding cassette domain-containing protein [Alloscardovia theropitheci]TCD54306.1 sugar ABC transporter ATP-binding protein [Alloscardovia theropitheci]
MTVSAHTPLLELNHICLSFDYIETLSDINLTMNEHEVVALVGDNGAGKSTLLKTIVGVYTPDTGSICLRGENVSIPNIKAASDYGIAAIFQDLSFCNNLDIAANIFLGQEKTSPFTIRNDSYMHVKAREILSRLTSPLSAFRSMEGLSTGEKQTVAIARAMLNNPDIILMDEPTASLSVIQTAQVLSYIKELRNQGKSILLVCHNLPDVFAVADRIAIMRHGKIVAIHHTQETTYEQIIAEIAGARQVNNEFINTESISVSHKLIDRYN